MLLLASWLFSGVHLSVRWGSSAFATLLTTRHNELTTLITQQINEFDEVSNKTLKRYAAMSLTWAFQLHWTFLTMSSLPRLFLTQYPSRGKEAPTAIRGTVPFEAVQLAPVKFQDLVFFECHISATSRFQVWRLGPIYCSTANIRGVKGAWALLARMSSPWLPPWSRQKQAQLGLCKGRVCFLMTKVRQLPSQSSLASVVKKGYRPLHALISEYWIWELDWSKPVKSKQSDQTSVLGLVQPI